MDILPMKADTEIVNCLAFFLYTHRHKETHTLKHTHFQRPQRVSWGRAEQSRAEERRGEESRGEERNVRTLETVSGRASSGRWQQ